MPAFQRLSVLTTLILCSAGCVAESRLRLYVSPHGSDDGSGTIAEPFRTIARAQKAVRQYIREGLADDMTVLIRGGTYMLDEPLVFGPEDGGTDAHAVVYAAWPGEEPVISGGRFVTGFTRTGESTWTADLADVKADTWWFRQLFMEDRRQPRARFPNVPDVLRITKTSSDVTQVAFDRSLAGGESIGQDAELVVIQNWCVTRARVIAAENASVTTASPVGWIGHGAEHNATWTIASPGKAAFLEHAPAFVDQAGEWYLDRAAGRLTYRSEEGVDPNARSFVASRLPKVLIVRGERGAPVRNLHFRGLTLAHTEWPLPEFGYVGTQAGHYGTKTAERVYVLPAAVELAYAEGCGLERCRVLHTGASGIGLGAGCRGNRVTGCEVADAAGNGIMIGLRSDRELADKPGDAGLTADWTSPEDIPRDNAITNCYIHHAGVVYSCCIGIYDAYCQETLIAHNLVSDMPYTGISVGFKWDAEPSSQRGCRVEYNHVCDVMTLLGDGGAIYTLGYQLGTVLRGNLLHGVRRSEYAHGGAPNNGIFFDQGSKGYAVEGNIIYDTTGEPIRFNECTRDDFIWSDNAFGIDPTDVAFPHAQAARAGLQPAYQPLVTERLIVDDPARVNSRVKRFGSVVRIKKEKLDEYKRLHARIWPGVRKMIRQCNIRNFSIYLTEIKPGEYYLFSYLEYAGDDLEKDTAKMKADPISRRWWTYTDPCQFAIPAAHKGELWHSMEEVFHVD